MKALVVGGTGPTGPTVVNGLIARGFDVTIMHSGKHEVEFAAPVEHVHMDPHFPEPIAAALEGRSFNIALCMYGRLRHWLEPIRNKTERMVSIGGPIYDAPNSAPATERSPRRDNIKLFQRMLETEEAVARAYRDGWYDTCHLRYATLFGPRQLAPKEWSVIRRIRDGREWIPVADGGLTLQSRSFTVNAAHAVLAVVDHPSESAGQFYNVADETAPSDAEIAQAIAHEMGASIELVSFPSGSFRPAFFWAVGRDVATWSDETPPDMRHQLISSAKIRRELGYHETVPFEEALAKTVQWYLEHPPEEGSAIEQQLGDAFDYAGEDAFRAELDRYIAATRAIPVGESTYRHPYAHPTSKSS